MTTDTPLHPLVFEPIYKEKVWGGRRLEQLGRGLPGGNDAKIGESWELADLGATAVSGGGGGAARSVVAEGPLAGRTLHDLLLEHGPAISGDLPLTPDGSFPLLVKFLDAGENLSVQVHPSAAYARAHPDAHLKSECWYVLAADPGAAIYKGVREGVEPDTFRRAIERDTVEDLLIRVEVEPGEMHYLPSGTCHALGGGLLVAEVQTPSDTTFRVYDWGRTGRELHVEEALECIHFGPPRVDRYEKTHTVRGRNTTRTRLVTSEHFIVDHVRTAGACESEQGDDEPVVLIMLDGAARLSNPGTPDLALGAGRTALLPASLRDAMLAVTGPGTWLKVTFPRAASKRMA